MHAEEKKNVIAKKDEVVKTKTSKEYIDCVADFTSNIKILVSDLARRYPRDATIDRIHKRVVLAVDVSPLFAMEAVGEHLLNYEAQIRKGDDKFFLDTDYKEELSSGKEQKINDSKYIIPKVKQSWTKLDEKEKKQYRALVDELLDDYIQYKIHKLSVEADVDSDEESDDEW